MKVVITLTNYKKVVGEKVTTFNRVERFIMIDIFV